MLKILNEEYQAEEDQIIEELASCVNSRESLIFNAGAGAGKTYALVECLKYVCREKAEILRYRNQKAICITYTNVAANEIKNRLGNTDVILVSTIHERLWEIIKNYQEELLIIHLENLNDQIDILCQDIEKNKNYSSLLETQRKELAKLLVEQEGAFYDIYNCKAQEFKAQFRCAFPTLVFEISNVNEFRKTCSKIIKVEKYKQCILSITNREKGYTEVQYDAKNNKDYLHHMKISHDTLLEYSSRLICKYKELQRFIADKYPYFFIDEYQDTNEIVVKILAEIENYAKEINHSVFIGYFGDSAQNIYDSGIGIKIEEYCKGYKCINKNFNRRSCDEIISLANKIRHDTMNQQSIYRDSMGGSVKTYYGSEADIEDFICANSDEMRRRSIENKSVHCFLLMNKIVAEHAGIAELYNWFNNTPFYKQYYDMLGAELLSNDENKLGEIERYLYNLTEFFSLSGKEDTPLLDIFPEELLSSLDIESVIKVVNSLGRMTASSLEDMIIAIALFRDNLINQLQEKRSVTLINRVIDSITGIDNFSVEQFKFKVKDILFQGNDNSDEQINAFMNLDKDIIFRWYQYINRNYQDETIYHTFHSTKGLEYDNVIMIFGDSFGKNRRDFFSSFFGGYYGKFIDENQKLTYRKARNLLYVAITRARINLRILYTGDYYSNKDVIDEIFDGISPWK